MTLPVTLITGFLGSGKTTLLNRLLREPALADSAVIVNEFGEVAIDHLLVTAPAENMVVLDTGCLCCTVRGDLVQTLSDLHAKRGQPGVPAFSNVIIEASGLADPVPVLQSLVADETLRHLYRVHDVVTLVDAVHGEAQLDTQGVSVKQAAVADALLVTKTDLASAHATRVLRERLGRLNPGAEICEVVRGEIDPALFLRGGVYESHTKPVEVERWLKAAEYGRAAHAEEEEDDHAHAHDEGVRAFCLYHERTIRRAGLVMWLDMLAGLRGANLLRVKGILNVEGEPVVVQAVQTVVHEPVVLDTWPTGDRRSRLVFITRGMSRDDIERTFEAFDYAPPSTARTIDPAAYAQFVAAMQGFTKEEESEVAGIPERRR